MSFFLRVSYADSGEALSLWPVWTRSVGRFAVDAQHASGLPTSRSARESRRRRRRRTERARGALSLSLSFSRQKKKRKNNRVSRLRAVLRDRVALQAGVSASGVSPWFKRRARRSGKQQRGGEIAGGTRTSSCGSRRADRASHASGRGNIHTSEEQHTNAGVPAVMMGAPENPLSF